jgi:hypothetical protein
VARVLGNIGIVALGIVVIPATMVACLFVVGPALLLGELDRARSSAPRPTSSRPRA